MIRACDAAAAAVERCAAIIRPGLAPYELRDLVFDELSRSGAHPVLLDQATKTGDRFPAPLCVSVNHVAVNGVPGNEPCAAGDLATIDVACSIGGWHADCATTVLVGIGDDTLIEAARGVLRELLDVMRPGVKVGTLNRVYREGCRERGCAPVGECVLHGIGSALHQPPFLLPTGPMPAEAVLHAGDTLAVEPVVASEPSQLQTGPDGWSRLLVGNAGAGAVRAAYEERTVVVEPSGVRILTRLPRFGV